MKKEIGCYFCSDDYIVEKIIKADKEKKQQSLINLILESGKSDKRKLELIKFVFDK